jgi:large subunit ribosomal protein L13
MATEVARILRGKHKATFAPHIDTGDHVIIINADKIVLTSGKAEKKMVYRHSGFPGGIKSDTYEELLNKKPAEIVRQSIRGMLPKNRLGASLFRNLRVYGDENHTQDSQKPKVINIKDYL